MVASICKWDDHTKPDLYTKRSTITILHITYTSEQMETFGSRLTEWQFTPVQLQAAGSEQTVPLEETETTANSR